MLSWTRPRPNACTAVSRRHLSAGHSRWACGLGEVRDISFEGLWLPTAEPLFEQTRCRVTIHLSEEIAIQFLELLDLESYGHLRNLILFNSHDTATIEQEFDRYLRLRGGNPSISLPE